MRSIGIFIAVLFSSFVLRGATIPAASVSYTDVAAAVALSTTGDTVTIPAGTATWTSTLDIAKGITLSGAGTNQTIIADNIPGASPILIRWTTSTNVSYRMSAIGFTNASSRVTSGAVVTSGLIQVNGTSQLFRLDHCDFRDIRNENIVYNGTYGVLDHCYFYLPYASWRMAMVKNGNMAGGSYGDTSWNQAADWGGPNNLFIEDCIAIKPGPPTIASYSGIIDGWNGGRYVIRYGYYENGRMVTHGTESSQRERSLRSVEIYMNVISNKDYTLGTGATAAFISRGGGGVIWSNTIAGTYRNTFLLNAFRGMRAFPPWGGCDGTKLWDGSDGTIYDTGTTTSATTLTLTDAAKSWTNGTLHTNLVRIVYTNTATSGALRSATVAGAGWTVNQWLNYEFTKPSTQEKSFVSGNTSDTLTLSSSYYALNMSGGGEFILSFGIQIKTNTATTLTVLNDLGNPTIPFTSGMRYEIRKATFATDQPGRGTSDIPAGASPIGNQNLNQALDPMYFWQNIYNGSTNNVIVGNSGYNTILQDRDYYINVARPSYTPYVYPHPLVSPDVTPSAPTNLLASTLSSSAIVLTWTNTAGTNAQNNYVERSLTGGGVGFTFRDTVAGTTSTYTNTSLDPATTYYYRVQAVNGLNGSGYSNETNATTQSLITQIPYGRRVAIPPRIVF